MGEAETEAWPGLPLDPMGTPDNRNTESPDPSSPTGGPLNPLEGRATTAFLDRCCCAGAPRVPAATAQIGHVVMPSSFWRRADCPDAHVLRPSCPPRGRVLPERKTRLPQRGTPCRVAAPPGQSKKPGLRIPTWIVQRHHAPSCSLFLLNLETASTAKAGAVRLQRESAATPRGCPDVGHRAVP